MQCLTGMEKLPLVSNLAEHAEDGVEGREKWSERRSKGGRGI